jgi:hypothetical protein
MNVSAASIYKQADVLPCPVSKMTGVHFPAGAEIFLCPTTARPALETLSVSYKMGTRDKVTGVGS